MEAPADQSAGRGSAAARASKLRYPLRSATREKAADAPPNGSDPKRAKPYSDVRNSVAVLDLSSVKDKPVKPPRRHSIPAKPGTSPRPSPAGTVTPLSGIRSGRSDVQGKTDTPTSDVSLPTARRRFSTLSSLSYWMTQIKLAEASSKHSVSLGFFKLALESECEPLDRMREELKAYVVRHRLAFELEEPVKDILEVYDIVDNFEKLKISSASPQLPKEKKSASTARSVTSVSGTGNLKPRSLNSDAAQNVEPNKKESVHKVKPDSRLRASYNRNPAKNAHVKEATAKHVGKNAKKPAKGQQEVCNGITETSPISPDQEAVDMVKEVTHEDKENMGDVEMLADAVISQEI